MAILLCSGLLNQRTKEQLVRCTWKRFHSSTKVHHKKGWGAEIWHFVWFTYRIMTNILSHVFVKRFNTRTSSKFTKIIQNFVQTSSKLFLTVQMTKCTQIADVNQRCVFCRWVLWHSHYWVDKDCMFVASVHFYTQFWKFKNAFLLLICCTSIF